MEKKIITISLLICIIGWFTSWIIFKNINAVLCCLLGLFPFSIFDSIILTRMSLILVITCLGFLAVISIRKKNKIYAIIFACFLISSTIAGCAQLYKYSNKLGHTFEHMFDNIDWNNVLK